MSDLAGAERNDRELQLVAACARYPLDPAGIARICTIAAQPLDWARTLRIARHNSLAPLVFWSLNQACRELVPADTFERLRDRFTKNSALNALRTAQLLDLLSLLEGAGVQAIPYKGPAAAVFLYGNVALREFSDLDILVREQDVWDAARVLQSAGFVPDHQIDSAWRADFLRDDYVLMFRGHDGRTLIELHWKIGPRSFGVPIEARVLWPRLRPAVLQGSAVLMPAIEDQLLLIAVHATRHRWDKLEAVAGVVALLRQHDRIDWPLVWDLASRMRCRRMLAFGLLLAHRLFDVPLPPGADGTMPSRAFDALVRDVVARMAAADAPASEGWPLFAFHLRMRDSVADAARQVFGQLSTTTPIDRASFPLARPLSFAYPLVRAVRIARKYGFNH